MVSLAGAWYHAPGARPAAGAEGILLLSKALKLSLLMAAGIAALMACEPAARPPAMAAAPAQGGGEPPSEPTPTPQPAEKREKSWTIGTADFGNDELNLVGEVSNRASYDWEPITAGADVSVSIGGHDLPFTSTAAKPVFASDISGAEWKVAAEVRAGAIVLVLTAPDQSGGGAVELVTITNPGSGYTSPPTVSFSAPPPGGAAATGTAVGPDRVASVTVDTAGSGYTSLPTVSFSAPPSGGATATGTAAAGPGSVASVDG